MKNGSTVLKRSADREDAKCGGFFAGFARPEARAVFAQAFCLCALCAMYEALWSYTMLLRSWRMNEGMEVKIENTLRRWSSGIQITCKGKDRKAFLQLG